MNFDEGYAGSQSSEPRCRNISMVHGPVSRVNLSVPSLISGTMDDLLISCITPYNYLSE